MRNRTLVVLESLAIVALVGASSARAAEEPDPETEAPRRGAPMDLAGFRLDYTAGARVGGGYGHLGATRELDAGLGLVSVDLQPRLNRGKLHLRIPLALDHEQTFGASLSETRGAAGLEAAYRLAHGIRVYGEGGLEWVRRADWPDPYQPVTSGGVVTPDGRLATTNRFGYRQDHAGLGVQARPAKDVRVEAEYRFRRFSYPQDPAFDPVLRPMHLTPGDFSENGGRLRAQYEVGDWTLQATLDAAWRSYGWVFARDARTGLTHSGPGGLPPNPLQRLRELEPLARVQLRVSRELELSAAYGFAIQDDLFEGYYSYRGHHPSVSAHWQSRGFEARAVVEARLLTYGSNGYAPSCDAATMEAGTRCSHPPLDYFDGGTATTGSRRDDRVRLALSASKRVGQNATVFVEAHYLRRVTNYPDYVPGVNPRGGDYSIDWDYDAADAMVGVAYQL